MDYGGSCTKSIKFRGMRVSDSGVQKEPNLYCIIKINKNKPLDPVHEKSA